MIQFLLPLLGSMGGSALAGSLGSSLLTKALLTGLGGAVGTGLAGGSTKDALLSGLLTGGLGAFLSQGGGAASALSKAAKAGGGSPTQGVLQTLFRGRAPEVAKATTVAAPNLAGQTGQLASFVNDPARQFAAGAIRPAPPASGFAQSTLGIPQATQAPGVGPLQQALNFAGQRPGVTMAGLGALASALPVGAPVPVGGQSTRQQIPENFPNYRGPRQGYAGGNMTAEDYSTYGRVGGSMPRENAFFQFTNADMPGGGRVSGGAPGRDTVPAIGPGGQPFLLDNGEYVLNREAVDLVGGRVLGGLNDLGRARRRRSATSRV